MGTGPGHKHVFLWPAHWFKTILSFLIAEAFPNRFNCFHESDPQTAMTSQDVKQHSSTQEKRSVWTCKGLRWEIIKPWTMSNHSSKIRPTLVPTLIKAYWKSPAFSSSLLKLTLLKPYISSILQKVGKCQKKEHNVRYGGGNGKKGFAHCWKDLEDLLAERELHLVLLFWAPDCQRSKLDLIMLSVVGSRGEGSG